VTAEAELRALAGWRAARRACLLAALLAACVPAPPEGYPWPAFNLQGHRGARGLYPENTLAGFAAAAGMGVTAMEMDVGLSRDGIAVVHHDRRLNPEMTRDATGAWISNPAPALRELSYRELQAYDIGRARPGGGVAKSFPDQRAVDGERIPSLLSVLRQVEARARGALRFAIETKLAPDGAPEWPEPAALVDAVLRAVDEAGVRNRVTLHSFDWRTLRYAQSVAPEIPTVHITVEADWLDTVERGRPGPSPWTAGFDVDDYGGSVPALVRAAGGTVWACFHGSLTPEALAEAHRLGLRVQVWTVNQPADMARFIDMGVDGVTTDYPPRLRRVMAARGLPLPPAAAGD